MQPRRPPESKDFEDWVLEVLNAPMAPDLLEDMEEMDFNNVATGWLMARGVDYKAALDWELCSAMNCGDGTRYDAAVLALSKED